MEKGYNLPIMEGVQDHLTETSTHMFCVPCSEDNKQCVAVCFCTSCIEYLCDNCYANHKRFKLLRNHTFLKGEEMPKDISHFVKMSTFGYCKLHSGREIEYKCINHNVYICSSCVTVNHRNCTDLECIDTIDCDKEKLKEEYLERMTKLNRKIDKMSAQKVAHAESIENKTLEEENAAKDFVVAVKDLVYGIEQLPQETLINFIREEASELKMCLEACEQSRRKIKIDQMLIETVLQHGNKTQILMLDDEVRKAEKCIDGDLKPYESSENNFPTKIMSDAEQSALLKLKDLVDKRVIKYCETSSSVVENLETEAKSKTGHMKDETPGDQNVLFVPQAKNSAEMEGPNAGSKVEIPVCEPRNATPTTKLNDNNARDENVASDSADTHSKKESSLLGKTLYKASEHAIYVPKADKKCCHSKSVLLEDGKMLIFDEANRMLKLIAKDFTVLHYEILNKAPQDFAVSNSGEVAVAYNKEIHLYQMTSSKFSKETRILYTREPITSMATLNDNLAILFIRSIGSSEDESDDDSEEHHDGEYEITVQIRTFRNKILVDKNDFHNANGQTVTFRKPLSICIRNNEEIIILEKRQFKVFGINAQLKWFYKFNLQHLTGVTFDTECNIYVCDKSTKQIRLVEANKYMKNRCLASLCERPVSILFNSKDKTVILGFEDNDLIHVYKFN